MSGVITIGRKRNLKLNKYLLFEIFSYVFNDYQTIQIVMKLGK